MSHDEVRHPPLRDGKNPEAPPLAPWARWKSPDEPPRIWDHKRNVDRLLYGFYAVSTLLVLMDFVIHRHVIHPWENLFGFYAWYGFAACWMLVVIAKQMRRVLMRGEDHYDAD
jgi:hypothetical protein